MEITKEQVAEAFKVDSSRDAILSTLSENGYWVKSSQEKDTFLNEERTRVREDVVNRIKGETYGSVDEGLLAAFNVPKNQGEKTTDYAVRIANSFKEQAGQVDDLQSKISTLETQLKNGTGHETLKSELNVKEQQLTAVQAQLEELKGSLKGKDEALFKNDVGLEFVKATQGLKFKKGLPESMLDSYLNTERANITAQAKRDEAGNIRYYEDDKVLLDDKMQPATMDYIVKQRLKDVIDAGTQAQGSRNGQEPKTLNDGTINTIAIKSQMDLVVALKEAGKIEGTKEFIELQDKYIKELNLENKIR